MSDPAALRQAFDRAPIDRALDSLRRDEPKAIEDLVRLAKIPSVSTRPVPDPDVRASADCVAELMAKAGLDQVEVLEVPGAHPYVLGSRIEDRSLPTLLLYAHHDVQPEGDPKRWTHPPFEPRRRGERLYGRGVVDDKAGVLVHLAAIAAWRRGAGRLPVNVRFLVEGEEEIGSRHLAAFLRTHRSRVPADAIVLTDTANLAAGLPSLTTRLRGLVKVDVEVRGLSHALHSGMWGGPVPDPVQGMSRLLATLLHADGSIAVKGLATGAIRPTKAARAALARLPYDERALRRDGGLLPGVALHAKGGGAVYEALWYRPSLVVSALEASPIEGSSNQIVPSARARIGVRIVPGQDPKRVEKALVQHLESHAPWGLQVRVTSHGGAPAWWTRTEGAAFDAARRALEAGYGKRPVEIGAGGSIPFVGPFAEALGGVPALLIGLEDPACNAHAEDESLYLPDFYASCRSAVHLYAELAGALKAPRRRASAAARA